jgi:cbb3-type cytochrome oxidase subunit 1
MSPLSKNFVRASLIYFFIAAILGTIMISMRSYPAQLLFSHVHLNLLGWMSMMIYGVGYHILPRFSGTPLAYPKIGNLQFYLANIGLVGLVSFRPIHPLAEIFAGLQVVSAGLFVFNIWMSMIPPKPESE